MKKYSVLVIVSVLHLILSSIWSVFYFKEMNDGKGWGPLLIVGLFAIGVIGLLVSWVIGLLCKKYVSGQPHRIQNTIEIALIAGFLAFLWISY